MRLTTKTDYCLRILIFLQSHKGMHKIQKIADTYQISKNHLSVAANKLSELGYVISTSGPNGGIVFNPRFAEKTVADLVTAIEDFEMAECFNNKTNKCNLSSHCKLKSILKNATSSFVATLKNYKIKDLV